MTLVEVMVAVAVTSVLLGVVVTLFAGLQQWDRRFRDMNLHRDQRAQLLEIIRTDIRNAKDVAVSNPQVLEVSYSNSGMIRYELTPNGCLRTKFTDGKTPSSRGLFSIGGNRVWRLDRDTTGVQPLIVVAIQVSSSSESTGEASKAMGEAHAVIGADRPSPSLVQQTGSPSPDSPKQTP